MVSVADYLDKNSLKLGYKDINGKSIFVKDISEDEFNVGWKAVCELTQFFQERSMYKMISRNFDDFTKSVSFAHKEIKKEIDLVETRMIQANVNRCIINYLSLVVVYINRLDVILRKKYGNENLKYKDFKQVCSLEYDTFFEYRFIYDLRNFSQHWGMPVSVIGLTKTGDLILTIDTDYLLESNFNWKKQIKEEIEKKAGFLNFIPIINQMNKSLINVDKAFINSNLENILLKITEAESFISGINNDNPIIFGDSTLNSNEITKLTLSKKLIREVKEVIRKFRSD
jgi:hypothetical protein